jgi:type VI secretion system secreted protein VgrG
VRVSQTGGLGNVILPRVGHEVLVDFLDGDPDRPMVMGRVFNRSHMPVYDLPANKTRAVWRTLTYGASGEYPETEALDSGQGRTSNEIRFEDKGGQEEMFIHAERDMNSRVRFDETRHVGHNQDRRVGLDRTTNIGRDDTNTIGRDSTNTINGKRQSHVIGTDALLVDGALSIESKTAITIRVKNSQITIGPDRITIQSPTVEIQANQSAVINAGDAAAINGKATLVLNGGQTNINPDGLDGNAFGSPANLGPAAGAGGE